MHKFINNEHAITEIYSCVEDIKDNQEAHLRLVAVDYFSPHTYRKKPLRSNIHSCSCHMLFLDRISLEISNDSNDRIP